MPHSDIFCNFAYIITDYYMMKKLFFLFLATAIGVNTVAAPLPLRVETFPVSQVRLSNSPFLHNQRLDISYLLALDADRLLAPYRKEAGLQPKADNYSNWENTGLDGHMGGHYLSALSYMWAATGHEEIGRRLDYVLSELQACQQARTDGYLGGVPQSDAIWSEIARGDIRAASFGLNDRWVPLYNIHKMYAGLRDAWLVAGRAEARRMLVAFTDWMVKEVSRLTDDQVQQMLVSEHGGLNEVFADVAAITGDKKYLRLARQFSDRRLLEPLLEGRDCLTGMHANTQIPKVIGYKRVAELEGLADWNQAAAYFWDVVVRQRSVSIGGNSMREHFHPADDFTQLLASEQGPETCNTYNMLRLSKMLYQTSADKNYMDYYERALYNHILSSMDPVQGGFVYFTPMRSGHYRVYSQPHTSMWCCVGTGMENPARYGEMIYAHEGRNLVVNLFIPSILTWDDLTVSQTGSFPLQPSTQLTLRLKQPRRFALKIRRPSWCPAMTVTVNGTPVAPAVSGSDADARLDGGYFVVDRSWRDGDRVEVSLPMHLTAEQTPDGGPQYSFLYGPLVLAAKTGTDRQDGLFADDSRGGHIANGPQLLATQLPALIGPADSVLSHVQPVSGQPLTFRLSGTSMPAFEGQTLVPFYQLYECRYQLYFPQYTAAEWESRRQQMATDEQARLALEAATVDHIFCGEQQSENDHAFLGPDSWNGADAGQHWRRTASRFSYQVKTSGARTLMLKGFADPESLVVTMAGRELPAVRLDAEGSASVSLPAGLPSTSTLVFAAPQGTSATPRLIELRLLR